MTGKSVAQPYFAQLDACHLVVNVYKHGFGDSFIKLKRKYPQFLKDIMGGVLPADELGPFLDYTHLTVADEDLAAFSNAIIAFWKDVPHRTTPLTKTQINTRTPKWFSKAIKEDS